MQKKTPFALTRCIRSQSSSSTSIMSKYFVTPALLTTTSSRPKASLAWVNMRLISFRSPMSAGNTRLSRPICFMAIAVSSAVDASISDTATFAPSSASCKEIARPIPRPAPVTKAILSSSCITYLSNPRREYCRRKVLRVYPCVSRVSTRPLR